MQEATEQTTTDKQNLTPGQKRRIKNREARVAALPGPQYLSRDEAAQYLGLSVDTLAKWATLGRPPAFTKLGTGRTARVRYDRTTLDAFMASLKSDNAA